MIAVIIDEITPCLRDMTTGEIIQTEVIRLTRPSFLIKYNKKNGWYTNWSELLKENEVYALVIKGTVDVQGLVALAANSDYKAVHISWMCTAPHNNKVIASNPKYGGVGGHLFAIAAQKSVDYGFDGAITGFAANIDLVNHYKEMFHAVHLGLLHPYHIYINGNDSKKIREEYIYDWTDDEL